MNLPYDIYGAERAEYLKTTSLPTSPAALDRLASYILYKQLPQQSSNHSDNRTLPLNTAASHTPAQAALLSSYTNPHTTIDWRLPCLQPIAETRDLLLGLIETAPNPTQAALLQKQLLATYRDIAPTLEAYHPYVATQGNPSRETHDNTPDLLYCIEWDNPDHISIFISHYRFLAPNDPAILHFATLCRLSPFTPAQLSALLFCLEGVPYKEMSPPPYGSAANLSHGKKRIYAHIAAAGLAYHKARKHEPHPPCAKCGQPTPTPSTLHCYCHHIPLPTLREPEE